MQVATDILAAVFFGCRSCSLFDIRVKFDDSNKSDEPPDTKTIDIAKNGRMDPHENKVDGGRHMRTKRSCNTVMVIDSGCEVDSDPGRISDNVDNNSDSEFSSTYADDRGSDTDNNCDAELEETRTFLYRHFTITIVANKTPGKPNLVFIKATLLHTKGENNNPRM